MNYPSCYVRSKVKKLLLDGVTLIVDRYAYSGVVFSAAKKVCQCSVTTSFELLASILCQLSLIHVCHWQKARSFVL
jgi:thymidylate kinase